ncbi:MAG: hypothetical protein AAGC70_08190 [Pseudomonadota bacterium]
MKQAVALASQPLAKNQQIRMCLVILVAAASAIIYFRLRHISELSAYLGFLPTALANPTWLLETFRTDFPNGVPQLLKSLPFNIYPLLGSAGLTGAQIHSFMMPLEIVALAVGGFVATRHLNPQSCQLAALLVGLYLFGSHFANSDLGRWWFPFYGSVYTYAYGFGLSGASLAITGRLVSGSVLLALAIATHPVLGGLCCVFTASAMLPNLVAYRLRDVIAATVVGLSITGSWWLITLRDAGVTGATVPAETYVALTKLMSSHQYPISMETFGYRHFEKFFPFLSFLILLSIALTDRGWRENELMRRVAAGFSGLLIVAVAGVFLSEYSGMPIFTKLALHRATGVLLVIGLVFVIPMLWRDVVDGPNLRSLLALLLLCFPFVTRGGVPFIWAVIYAALVLSSNAPQRNGKVTFERKVLVSTSLAALAAAILSIVLLSRFRSITHNAYTGSESFVHPIGLVLLAIVVPMIFFGQQRSKTALVAIGVAALAWAPNADWFTKYPARLENAQYYHDAQLWVSKSTPKDALFMPDPVQAYAWREHARRPSFGSVREWLFTGWLYDTRAQTLNEGIRRFAAFGFEIEDYLEMERQKHWSGRNKIYKDLRTKYYSADLNWFKKMSSQFGIDYFVFDRRYLKGRPPIEVVYSNPGYFVARAPRQIDKTAKQAAQ